MDLSNILAQIADFTCNLVWILDCDFIVQLLADPNLDKTIVGSADFASNFGGFVYPYSPPLLWFDLRPSDWKVWKLHTQDLIKTINSKYIESIKIANLISPLCNTNFLHWILASPVGRDAGFPWGGS